MQLIAHRGFAGLMPENSLAAFQFALQQPGCVGVECDLRLTADGALVLHHDGRLNRGFCRHQDGDWLSEQGPTPAIHQLNYNELQQYRIGEQKPGSLYANAHPLKADIAEARIPLFRELLALCRQRADFLCVAELKTPVPEREAQAWLPLARKALAEIANEQAAAHTVFCSFHWDALNWLGQHSSCPRWYTTHPLPWLGLMPANPHTPEPSLRRQQILTEAAKLGGGLWPVAHHPKQYPGSAAERLAAAIAKQGGRGWFMHYSDVNEQTVAACKAAGILLCAWSGGVVPQPVILRLQHWGVAYFCGDDVGAAGR
ncbi:glycerophosphodiester phosphodiesterase [Alkalimonas amylolytica]|uniref:Glycerophosphoryl diester phosphodiesterase n=1 Tax=Alkalimonas amylolytica TaxID=152573 RepID=A0A1H3ZZW9_ALKAM|nr:glycerophosphodiester phosphodiesterase family protein [Alkalimonas amylolytica]SEA29245.1 glycerophosphoryl diester phosphodiesterase [Alkalimonas amylolytica]